MCSQRRPSTWPHFVEVVGIISTLTCLGCSGAETPAPIAPAPNPPTVQAVAEGHVEAAKRLSAERNYSAAIGEYTTALATMRDRATLARAESVDADVLFERGVAYLNLGFPDTAAADFTEVLRMRPEFGAAYSKRGEAYTKLGDLYKAVRDCTDAIRYDPDCAYAYRFRGEAYLARGQFERSVADLQQAVVMEPALAAESRSLQAKAYLAWSNMLERIDEHEDADAKLAIARELDPTLVAQASRRPAAESDEAIELTAAKQVVDLAQESYERGVSRLAAREYDQALAELSAAIDARSDFADAYLRRGETLLAMNFPDTAVKDLETAVHYGGDSVEGLRLEARAFMALGSPHRAAQAATDALHADPTDAASYALRGAAYVDLHNWDRAIIDLEEALRRDPNLAAEVRPMLERAYRLRDAAQASDVAPVPVAS